MLYWSSLSAWDLFVNLESEFLSTYNHMVFALYIISQKTCECITILASPSLFFSTVTYLVINSADIVTFYQFNKLLISEVFTKVFYLEKDKYISDILSFMPAFFI